MTMEIKKAIRKAIPFIGCFYGKSGGGKTYSAIKLARGLIGNDNRICIIDTENGRASHYADEFDFDVIDLEPPFTPSRYIEAIRSAENAGYKAIVIDSISHEWDGMGGCLEMAEGKQGLGAWAKPKAEHRKLMNMLLQAKSHIIFCARAKDEMEQVKINGKTEIVNKGLIPIQEKNFPFEMLVTFKMENKGKVILEKCIKSLESSLKIKDGEFVGEAHGKIIADWINKGDPVDFEMKKLQEEARDIAMSQGSVALTNWFSGLNEDSQLVAKRFNINFKRELSKIAKDKDSFDGEEAPISKVQNQFSSLAKINLNWYDDIKNDFPNAPIGKEKIVAITKTCDELLDELGACETLEDFKKFEISTQKDMVQLKRNSAEDHKKLTAMISAHEADLKLVPAELNINLNQL